MDKEELRRQELHQEVSDFYKDVHGFRYRGPTDIETLSKVYWKLVWHLEQMALTPYGREQMRQEYWIVNEPIPCLPAHYNGDNSNF